MEFNKSMYSELKEEKYPSGYSEGNNGSRIVKNIFSSFGKGWNNLFSIFFKPKELIKVSNFQTTSHNTKEHFNEGKCNGKNINVTHFPDHQSIVLPSESNVLYFPQPLKNYDFKILGTLLIPKQLCMHSVVTVDNPSEILKNVNGGNSKYFEQNMTLTNVSESDTEICKTDAKNIINFHFFNKLIGSVFFCRHASRNALSNSEDSYISLSLIPLGNDCENKRNNWNIYYASEKSSASTSFSENSHSAVIDVHVEARFSHEFGKFLESLRVHSLNHRREPSYMQYLNTNRRLHEVYYKPCLKNVWYDNDMYNISNAELFRNYILATFSNLCSLTSNFDQEILDNICVNIYAMPTESSREILMLEKNTREENFQYNAHKYDVNNVKNNGPLWNYAGTSKYSISKIYDHVSYIDRVRYDKVCLQVKFNNNYSVNENIQHTLKSGQTINLLDIRYCFNNNFSTQNDITKSNLCRKFNKRSFAKLEENTKNCYETDNRLSIIKYKEASACEKMQNHTDKVRIKSIKGDLDNSCEGVNTYMSLENASQGTFDYFPNAVGRIKHKCSRVKKVVEMSNKEMFKCVYEGWDKKEENRNLKITLNKDCKTNVCQGKKSYENQNKAILWSDLDHVMEQSSDESDTLLSDINDLENEFDFPNLPEAPCNYAVCWKKLDENDNIDSRKAKTYMHEYHFYLNKKETSVPEFMQDLKQFNSKNKEQKRNAYVETGDKIQDYVSSLKMRKPLCKAINKDCELNEYIHENIAYSKQKNGIGYDTDYHSTLDRYSYAPMIHKGKCSIRNLTYGNEILRSKFKCSKRKNVDDKNATSEGYKKRHKTSSYEKEGKTKSRKYLEHFTKYSKDKSDLLVSNTTKQEKKLNFMSLSHSPSCSTRYKTERNKESKFDSIKNVKCKRKLEFDVEERKANTQSSKFAQNHFYNGTGKHNINLCHTGRDSNIQSPKEAITSREIRKKFAFGGNIRNNNYQIETRQKTKISKILQNGSRNFGTCATPIMMQQSKTKTACKISNSNTTNGSLLSAKYLQKKSKDQVEKKRKISTGYLTEKRIKLISPTDYQNFRPDSELVRRDESMKCEIFPTGPLRAEKYKISKSAERKRKNSECKIVKPIRKSDRKSESKPKHKHHSTECKKKSVKTELIGNKILNRKRFCIRKEAKGKGSSEIKQLIKHPKRDKKPKSVRDLIASSHLDTFESHEEESFNHEKIAKNNYHTLLVSKTKSSHYCYFGANESSSFRERDFSETSSDEIDCIFKSKDVQSSKYRTQKTKNKQRKKARIMRRKPTHVSSYVNEIVPVDDLLLKSRRESIEKAYNMYTVLKPQNTRKQSHLKNKRKKPKAYSKVRDN